MSFRALVDQFAKNGSQECMGRLVKAVRQDGVDDDGIALLARRMAESGEMLSVDAKKPVVSFASTGGPSSLSTLVCPLYLRALGNTVFQLAVPGRPAGAVDVVSQVPGYRPRLTGSEIRTAVQRAGYVHCVASAHHAPRDAELYAFRRESHAVALPELTISSLLAKGLASGISLLGLDVRVARHGNLGATWEAARANSGRLVRVGRSLGIEVKCFLNDVSTPCQPYIGRGEALFALARILDDNCSPWLDAHRRRCLAMASHTCPARVRTVDAQGSLKTAFAQNLETQGASFRAFEMALATVERAERRGYLAERDGFVGVDLARLRTALVDVQESRRQDAADFPDPAGVILTRMPGDFVVKGEVLATIRCKEDVWPMLEECMRQVFVLSDVCHHAPRYEEVRNA